ncbi:protealysin inhibitor emfourin [Streptomyces sp. NPDC005438]|uniref:protealysin inhibitor emfourin n=1 Tax=Streptomyces sp. NPDC005438 TaxID=3156880 RepID=UPI0033BECF91
MRIRVVRTGGFAGRRREASLETADRPDRTDLEELARVCAAEGHRAPPVGVPDGFSYRIEVDGHTTYCSDPRLSEAQRHLVTRLLREGA